MIKKGPNERRCPACEQKNAMRAVTAYNEREWPGSSCRYCGYFIPDVRSKHYDISCAQCSKPMGLVSLDYRHHELDNATRADVLRQVASIPGTAADKTKLLSMAAAQLPVSWEKRHADHLKLYHCTDCHAKRRADGVPFEDLDTHVRYKQDCRICGKQIGWVDHPEDHNPETAAEHLSRYHACTGECSEKAKEFIQSSRLVDAAVAGNLEDPPNEILVKARPKDV